MRGLAPSPGRDRCPKERKRKKKWRGRFAARVFLLEIRRAGRRGMQSPATPFPAFSLANPDEREEGEEEERTRRLVSVVSLWILRMNEEKVIAGAFGRGDVSPEEEKKENGGKSIAKSWS